MGPNKWRDLTEPSRSEELEILKEPTKELTEFTSQFGKYHVSIMGFVDCFGLSITLSVAVSIRYVA